MSEYKVGDKARVVAMHPDYHEYIGKIGAIMSISNTPNDKEPYKVTFDHDGETLWCCEIEPFNTHGLNIVHADDKTVTVKLTHEELAHLACKDGIDGIYWESRAKELNLKPFTGKKTQLRAFLRKSSLLDHLRPEPEPEKWVPKPGDPVRCVKDNIPHITNGKVYFCRSSNNSDLWIIGNDLRPIEYSINYFAPATDFRVGDVVEVIENWNGYKKGEIVKLKEHPNNDSCTDGWFVSEEYNLGIYGTYIRHTDKPLTGKFKPGWYVQVESDSCYGVMYRTESSDKYKTRIDSELKPIKLKVTYSLLNGVCINSTSFTETQLRQHALDIARDGSKKIGCTTITRDELPELIKFFEEFIPMARKAVEDEKARVSG